MYEVMALGDTLRIRLEERAADAGLELTETQSAIVTLLGDDPRVIAMPTLGGIERDTGTILLHVGLRPLDRDGQMWTMRLTTDGAWIAPTCAPAVPEALWAALEEAQAQA